MLRLSRDSKQGFSLPLLRKKPRGPNWVLRKSLCSARGSRGSLHSLEKPKNDLSGFNLTATSFAAEYRSEAAEAALSSSSWRATGLVRWTIPRSVWLASLFLDFFPRNSLCSQTSAQYTADDLDRDPSVCTALYWLWNGPTLLWLDYVFLFSRERLSCKSDILTRTDHGWWVPVKIWLLLLICREKRSQTCGQYWFRIVAFCC